VVDLGGADLRTGAAPAGPGAPSPVEALASVPVATWPLTVVCEDGRRLDFADVVGTGGPSVGNLLAALLAPPALAPLGDGETVGEVAALARSTPAGPLARPVSLVALGEAVRAAGSVPADWLAVVDARRAEGRRLVVGSGRDRELEAALRVTMLLAADTLSPGGMPTEGRVASGAQLWLLAGAVAWAMAGSGDNPFGPWATLVVGRLWPVGPVGHALVVGTTGGGG
jgi:hypothetical protein